MNLEYHSKKTYKRLQERLTERYKVYATAHPKDWTVFLRRLENNFEDLFIILFPIYGNVYDFFYYLENLLVSMANSWISRSAGLKKLDAERENHPLWFQSNQMVGGVCYVDLFAGSLRKIREKIPYFKEIGMTYLHLMPLFKSPAGENDGGYAISSYRNVNPKLGSMKQLASLAGELRNNGISLVLDFVFNHTSDEHEWAEKAKKDDPEYQEYYFMFSDRQEPDGYEANLREIFPEEHTGAFTYFPKIEKWVWTTFHSYQWDLNYKNPSVFVSMVEEMLFLANVGVEVLRLDAVAFIWKQKGTSCENLPEAHHLIQAFNLVTRIAAPSLVFKSEAIVHPDEVARYISPKECQLSYNPLLMSLLWESLATREVKLLSQSLQERFAIPEGCAWVNYVRCHDDIGWTFSDEDAARLDVRGFFHRQFLNNFYTGRFPGSFGRGLPFQENPKTGDCRISGTCASLAGLEKALKEESEVEVELAVRRILLIHSVILTIGGIPLFYLGDDIATLNDYSYRLIPSKSTDSRWVHRPAFNWERAERRFDSQTLEGRVFQKLCQLIQLRKTQPVFEGQQLQVIPTDNPHVLGYLRKLEGERLLIFANFSEIEQVISVNQLRVYGLGYGFHDLIKDQPVTFSALNLSSYEFICIRAT